MPAIEAAIGVVLLTTIALTLAVGVSAPATERVQLDAYASDVEALLASEPPQHGAQTRLAEVAASADAFDREHEAVADRIERILTDNLLYQVQTPHGTIGYPLPRGEPVGTATAQTVEGPVTIRVWYA